jgi:glycerol-1-phosphate dehydrogenase [NAD(P)+]
VSDTGEQVAADSRRHGLAVWRRYMELPRYLRSVHGAGELVRVVGELATALGFGRLAVVGGSTFTGPIASGLAGALGSAAEPVVPPVEANTEREVTRLAAEPALAAADAVVAVGGGKTIDVAKSACALAELPLLVVPTQLTADGIASPVSVLRDDAGRLRSGPGRLPIAVAVDLDVIAAAPVARTRAGLGDLLANPSALRDWQLAARAGDGEVDDFAALLSQSAFDLVYGAPPRGLADGTPDPEFLHRLLRGLVLSGLAMEIAGSSRPCSGSEHLISHALDTLHPGTAQHGEQVAFGALIATRLQGGDWRGLREFMFAAGLENAAAGFGLPVEVAIAVVRAAPAMRPERRTVLSNPDLAERDLCEAVEDVLAGTGGR